MLGTLFSNRVSDVVIAKINGIPSLAGKGHEIATAVKSGAVQQTLSKLPAKDRSHVALITKSAFTTGLDRILLIAAIVAFVTGALSLLLIRTKDFVHRN